MPLYKPDKPRPIVDQTNLTVEDLTTHLVRIANRAKMADEKMAVAEYNALLNLTEDYIRTLRRFQTTIREERERNRPPLMKGSLLTGLRQLSQPGRSPRQPEYSPTSPDSSSPSE